MPVFLVDGTRRSRQKRLGCDVENMSLKLNLLTMEQLQQYLEEENFKNNGENSLPFLLLDCRPFLSYTECHIIKAVNVHCPALLRRRSGGRLPIRTIIPNSEIREKVLRGEYSRVILYSEHGQETYLWGNSPEEAIVNSVARCLSYEGGVKRLYYLSGGMRDFRHRYPHLCTRSSSLVVGDDTSKSTNNWTSEISQSDHVHSSTPEVMTVWTLNSVVKPKPNSSVTDTQTSHVLFPAHEQEEPVQILSYLFLGSAYHASSKATLKHLGITALLNVSQTCPNHFENDFTYKIIPVKDSGSENIASCFNEAIEFIDNARSVNGKVLVHCQAGISRSATICIAYLMATKRLRMEEAYEYVRSRRQIVSPNFSFMEQLLSFESQVFSPSARLCCKPTLSPPSPLIAAVPRNPDPDSLTPSGGAHQNVFDFPGTLNPLSCVSSGLNTATETCHMLSSPTLCVTSSSLS
ncbi:dual specificity protein phosphatase 1-like [Tachypleus tridentatus]|uniref:dual specificity protein phosphatase 1-like n=1 Tax=Tachypleus tridentatus TaxID=6853 RepID=UPI003FD322BE